MSEAVASQDLEALILEHMPKAQKGAAKYALLYRRSGMPIDFDDCLGAAYEGLVYAASKYDQTKTNGSAFYTYAFHWMDQRMRMLGMRERRAKGWAYEPTAAEIAAGAVPNQMIRVVKVGPMPYDKEGRELDIIPARRVDDYEPTSTARLEQRAFVMSACATDRERSVVRRIIEGANSSAVASELGITRQRVSQILILVRDRARREIRQRKRLGAGRKAKRKSMPYTGQGHGESDRA